MAVCTGARRAAAAAGVQAHAFTCARAFCGKPATPPDSHATRWKPAAAAAEAAERGSASPSGSSTSRWPCGKRNVSKMSILTAGHFDAPLNVESDHA